MNLTDFLTDPMDTSLGATDPRLTSPIVAAAKPEHRGPFGSKGVLADILGYAMDSVIKDIGGTPVYAQRQQNQRLADAMGNVGVDNGQAVKDIAQVDAGEALKFYNEQQKYPVYQAQADSYRVKSEADAALKEVQTLEKKQKLEGPWRALAMSANSRTVKAIASKIRATASKYGYPPEELGFPETDDLQSILDWGAGGVSANTRYNADNVNRRFERSADQADARIDIARDRLNKPPAARAPGVGYRMLTAEEKQQRGLPSGAPYQMGSNGKVSLVSTGAKGKTGSMLIPGAATSAPPLDPKQYAGKIARNGDTRYKSDGNKWIKM